jgi:hypothetical protein
MEEELRKSEDADRRKKEEEKAREQGTGIRDQVPALAASVDSLVSESRPGAPSPYPGEDVYPRIHPPSTGEPVAAARPEFSELKTPESAVETLEASAAQAAPAAEQARHD